MDAIASGREAPVLADLLGRLRVLMAERGAHPSRTVVLVPYAQLMPVARRAWARLAPDGFSPRFETTMNWAARSGFAPDVQDLSFDRGQDLLTARTWLEQAGLGRQAGLLAPRLVDAAWQLASVAAAVHPAARTEWAVQARSQASVGLEHPVLAVEAAIARIAIEWAAASAYAADALLADTQALQLDLLVVLEGLQPEPVATAIAERLGERALRWPLAQQGELGRLAVREADGPAQEAEMAAACVVRHLEAGRAPVALAAVDRVLTRRIRAMLGARGVAVCDETGWKLSTTRAAAHVVGLLRAAAWDAGSDEVIDWLKNTPAVPPRVALALERRVRRAGLRRWQSVNAARLGGEPGRWSELIEQANFWRERLRQGRPLAQWQQALRELLQAGRLWETLEADPAGQQVIDVLGLHEAAQAHWSQLPQAARRLSPAEFSSWAGEALEAASFVPDPPAQEQVVILPFNQMLGRQFPALVVPGCDEVRLAASPEPPGLWTPAQRAELKLPTREQLAESLRAGWHNALQVLQVDLLHRRSDDSGEPVLPSPLVQSLLLDGLAAHEAADPRAARALVPQAVPRPRAQAPQLPVSQLSASAYEDLRRCPYRFFAMRQLGLQEVAEIDTDLDKRDFGTWLHAVLHRFHVALAEQGTSELDARRLLADRAAAEATRSLGLPDGEFLPFQAAWPQVREGYLSELARFEASEGARFDSGETDHEVQLGPVRLVGRIDRIDRLPDGRRMVMDYKTESESVTSARVKAPLEDTQLAFYAALLEDDSLRAAYVNVGERGETAFIEQTEVEPAREALVHGILDDLRRIGEGAPLQALGEGTVCEWCAARGLCRKDFWQA